MLTKRPTPMRMILSARSQPVLLITFCRYRRPSRRCLMKSGRYLIQLGSILFLFSLSWPLPLPSGGNASAIPQTGGMELSMDEDEQDEKHADEEKEGRGVKGPRRIRGQIQPMLFQRENEHDHAAGQPEDEIPLPESAPADHLEEIMEGRSRCNAVIPFGIIEG